MDESSGNGASKTQNINTIICKLKLESMLRLPAIRACHTIPNHKFDSDAFTTNYDTVVIFKFFNGYGTHWKSSIWNIFGIEK